MDEIKTYIIGVGGSDCDGVDFEIFTGTRENVIDRIWNIMEELRLEDEEDPDIRCEKDEISNSSRYRGINSFNIKISNCFSVFANSLTHVY